MVVTEIKNAVIETVEFLIPPFIELMIALFVANYVTSGIATQKLSAFFMRFFKSLDIAQIKNTIDSLYFTSIVPILVILLLILIAYSIKRITGFIGSLVPIRFYSTSAIRNPYYLLEVWKYFPKVQNTFDLAIKVKYLLSLAKASNLNLPFEQIEWEKAKRIRIYRNIEFLKFLLLWSIGCYFVTVKYFQPKLSSDELNFTVIIILLLIVLMYFQIVQNELDIEDIELRIVERYLQTAPDYTITVDLEELEQIQIKINEEKDYNKRWWSLSIGYSLKWLKMYKYYKPPFYQSYKNWKNLKKKWFHQFHKKK